MKEERALEAYIGIDISQDKLNASLFFLRAEDSFTTTTAELEQWIASNGIVFGIDIAVLDQIAKNPKPFFYNKTVIAKGQSPQDGSNGSIKYIYDMDDHQLKPAELEDGKVDLKEVIQLRNVRRGQLIAEKIPAEAARHGNAVTGEVLFGKDGKEARFKVGKNVVVGPDETSLYAAIDGMITKTDRDKINVFPVYEVNGDVDYNTGNIDFVGTVVVRGNVLTGFRIKASGDIRIIGGVEGAELESEGSIEITGGILAGHKGHILAGKNIKSSFIQEGNVFAAEDIIVSQSIMHSNVRAGHNVLCAGAKGLLVGGTVQAGEKVSARTIGNTMSTATTIEVGVKPELRAQLNELRSHLKTLTENLDKTEKALVLLDQLAAAGQLSSDKLAMRIKLTATKRQAADEQTSVKEQIFAIERTLDDTDRARVDAVNTVYGGTKIVIGRYTRFVKETVQRVSFRYSEGDIVMTPYY
ncbi:DUF342 domain-containing protein [Paenibacillus abyssi]|uniref:Flagellar Assembly Protein A N-terminal region domain-containing protein n=1 Tax=Paenibacillus abyssi TaxID=1340531 RepID=A0A917D635_9BACL|nr:FapA family protein [Paenibacillus abyssi]GGG12196.1 hypothetical protein GCM10010916_31330 [Paenibacillus abyssi]